MDHTKAKAGRRPDLDIRVRSSTEADFARYLKYVEQTEFAYEKTTLWFGKIKRGVVSYLIDYEAFDQFFEVKGYLDAKSLTKLKRVRIYHPEVFERLWLVKQGVSAKDLTKLEKIGFPLDRVVDTAYLYVHSGDMPEWESRKPSKKAIKAAEDAGRPLLSQIIENGLTKQAVGDVNKLNPVSKETECPVRKKQQRKQPQSQPPSSKTKSLKKNSTKSGSQKTSTKRLIPKRPPRNSTKVTTKKSPTTTPTKKKSPKTPLRKAD